MYVSDRLGRTITFFVVFPFFNKSIKIHFFDKVRMNFSYKHEVNV